MNILYPISFSFSFEDSSSKDVFKVISPEGELKHSIYFFKISSSSSSFLIIAFFILYLYISSLSSKRKCESELFESQFELLSILSSFSSNFLLFLLFFFFFIIFFSSLYSTEKSTSFNAS